jgi:hypothetical protein
VFKFFTAQEIAFSMYLIIYSWKYSNCVEKNSVGRGITVPMCTQILSEEDMQL